MAGRRQWRSVFTQRAGCPSLAAKDCRGRVIAALLLPVSREGISGDFLFGVGINIAKNKNLFISVNKISLGYDGDSSVVGF
jgi:hypothetical protein